MTRLVALLRGINVGGKHTVPMAELREVVEHLGGSDVRTYINSGNVVLTTDAATATLTARLEHALAQRFGFAVPVMARTTAALGATVAANPFPEGNPKQVCVGFVADRIPAGAADRLDTLATDAERFVLHPGEVFVEFGAGLGRSKLAAGLGKALGVPVTVRNVSTLDKILELADR